MSKVLIRPLEIKDALVSYKWRNDPSIWTFTGRQPDREITADIETEWIEKVLSDPTSRRFAIIVDDVYVGNIQLTHINERDAQYHIFIGDKCFWGKGIATRATYQILCFARETLKLEWIYLDVNAENIGAIKAYSKNGFTRVIEEKGKVTMAIELEHLAKPVVSVFVLVYNHANYLDECLNSILSQNADFDFEICVGEDCSPDDSRAILLKYQARYPGKFKLLLHQVNVGAIQNQNMLFDLCQGKYIAICEGDDYWTDPYKLQKQVDFLEEHNEYGLVYTDIDLYVQDTGVLTTHIFTKQYKPFTAYEDLIYFRYIAPCSWLMRSEVLFAILEKETLDSLDGTYILMLMFAIKSKIHFIADSTAVYRELPESASNTKSVYKKYVRSVDLWKTQARFINQIKPLSIHKEVNTSFVNNNLLWMLVYQDWDTFRSVRNLDLSLSKKFRLILQVARTKTLFLILSKLVKSISKRSS